MLDLVPPLQRWQRNHVPEGLGTLESIISDGEEDACG